MANEELKWTSPSPLWPDAVGAPDTASRRAILQQPTILRFATDTFMNDFMAMLDNDPMQLPKFVATAETWRGPTVGPDPVKPVVPVLARTLNRLRLAGERQKNIATQIAVTGGKGASSLVSTNALATVGSAPPSLPKLKLYQPAHQRYYLVTAGLVCGRAGLPDHTVNPGRQEKVTFVVRRLFPPGPLNINAALPNVVNTNTWEEYALVAGKIGNAWQRIPREKQLEEGVLVKGEEQLPLFAMNFTEEDGRRRRLFAGLIPAGRREAYMAATYQPQPGDAPPAVKPQPVPDARMVLVWSQFTEPWKNLIERADAATKTMGAGAPVATDPNDAPPAAVPLSGNTLQSTMKTSRDQIQTSSWYLLLDFAKFLQEQVNGVWLRLGQPVTSLITAEDKLVDALNKTKVDAGLAFDLRRDSQGIPIADYQPAGAIASSLSVALKSALNSEQTLEQVKITYDRENSAARKAWPLFLFPLADPVRPATLPPVSPLNPQAGDTSLDLNKKKIDGLAALIEAALPAKATGPTPAIPLVAQQPMDMREGWFVIRCAFERPECGPLDADVLSAPTTPFQIAGFFDPDAPARPIRIALPLDTSPAGLRKFDKNTAFMISDMLCGQIDRMKGLSLGDLVLSVLPWPFHKSLSVPDGGPCVSGGVEVGMICSLSIPIITICALLLLMIIVSLLDIIFRWVPFFIFCFPLPKFKSKG